MSNNLTSTLTSVLRPLYQSTKPIASKGRTIACFLRLQGINVTDSFLEKWAETTSDEKNTPLLLVSQIIAEMGLLVKPSIIEDLDCSTLEQISLPALIYLEDDNLAIIEKINKESITLYTDTAGRKTITQAHLYEIWKGFYFNVETSGAISEFNYEQHRKEEKESIGKIILLYLFGGLTFATFIIHAFLNTDKNEIALWAILFFMNFLGLCLCGTIIRFEKFKDSSLLSKVCGVEVSSSCFKIIADEQYKFFGLSYGDIGFAYFLGNLALLITFGSSSTLFILGVCASLLMIAYSVFHQAFMSKAWCKVCLLVQSASLGNAMALTVDGKIFTSKMLNEALIVDEQLILQLAVFSLALVVWSLISKGLNAHQKALQSSRRLQSFARNTNIASAIIGSMPNSGKHSIDGDFKLRFSSEPRVFVMMFFSTSCASCYDLLRELLPLIRSENLRIDLTLRLSCKDSKDEPHASAYKAAKHIIAIANTFGAEDAIAAFMLWFEQFDMSNIDDWLKQVPQFDQAELEKAEHYLQNTERWATDNELFHTPKLFINGYPMPDELIDFEIDIIRRIAGSTWLDNIPQ